MTLALVLSGGGARGAYEAGVLRYLLETLSRRAGEPVLPRIISGTSAGAINGAMVAACAGQGSCIAGFAETWRQMRIQDIYRVRGIDLLYAPVRMVGTFLRKHPSLVDAQPLHQLVQERIDWASVRKAIGTGLVSALVMTTTEVDTGRTVFFVDQGQRPVDVQSPNRGIRIAPARIGPEHCLASSAMPMLFPPVVVEGRLMVDGGLRLNTPLSPALRLGAERVLVVSVQQAVKDREPHLHIRPGSLSLAFLLGKALNALMLDPVEQDLRRLELLNDIFEWGEQAYGPDFLDHINPMVVARRGAPFRKVDAMLLRPSEDLGAMAGAAWASGKVRASRPTALLLSSIAATSEPGEADLLSFLLFDREFTAAIEELGHEDAAAREEELARFLGLGTLPRALSA